MEYRDASMAEILDAREARAERQRTLLQGCASLLCFTMNIAGPRKRSRLIDAAFLAAQSDILAVLHGHGQSTEAALTVSTAAGNELYLPSALEPEALKAMLLPLEEQSEFGRLLDLDVLRPDGSKVSRTELGLPERCCLICGEPGLSCARSRRHPVAELREATERILRNELFARCADRIASLAVRALLFEVGTTPKPGLVDLQNSGAHRDMDCFTFFSSAAALSPYFRTCALRGLDSTEKSPEALFSELRLPGLLAEAEMYCATGGVNTHKGAIFLIGTLCAAIGRSLAQSESWNTDRVLALCGEMSRGVFAELKTGSGETAGQRLYRQYGFPGVRGELAAGLPSVRDIALPTLSEGLARGLSLNDAAACALCHLAAAIPDTAMIARIGYESWKTVSAALAARLRDNPFPSMSELRAWDADFTEKNCSPGGCADLLAAALLLRFCAAELSAEPHLKS